MEVPVVRSRSGTAHRRNLPAGLVRVVDAAALGEDASVPTERAAGVAVPALIMDGGVSYPFMRITAMALANAMPHAQHRTLEGQTHEVAAEAIAPVLVEFFTAGVAVESARA